MAVSLIRIRIEQFKHIVTKVIELNKFVSIIGVRDFCGKYAFHDGD